VNEINHYLHKISFRRDAMKAPVRTVELRPEDMRDDLWE
jgi:hypothetical protein